MKRNLIAAAALIGLAIGGLALIDRFRERPAEPRPPHEPSQALISTPAQESSAPTGTPALPVTPPPPEVLNNEAPAPRPRLADAMPPTAPRGVTAPDNAAATDKTYVIQVGVFTSPANARAVRKQLKRAGMQAHLEIRVQLGPYRDKRDADKALAKARKLGIDAVLVNAR
ncbi:MAG: SPOR domain-containing protein [Betaproteobacteria bacterium]